MNLEENKKFKNFLKMLLVAMNQIKKKTPLSKINTVNNNSNNNNKTAIISTKMKIYCKT
jgi:hypothetical protein